MTNRVCGLCTATRTSHSDLQTSPSRPFRVGSSCVHSYVGGSGGDWRDRAVAASAAHGEETTRRSEARILPDDPLALQCEAYKYP
jgi:hypothetical protein